MQTKLFNLWILFALISCLVLPACGQVEREAPDPVEFPLKGAEAVVETFVALPGSENRLALVIHQTNYQNNSDFSVVASAKNEADLVASALQQTGFSITRVEDQTKAGLVAALDEFRRAVEAAGPDAIGFLYYTGHGAQHPQTGHSYLLGTDATLKSSSDLAVYGVDLETQRDGFAAAGAKAMFMVFDACRNRPQTGGFKSGTKGMGRIEAADNMLVAYSTGINDLAAEGVYAPVLAEEIRRPGQLAVTAFQRTQTRVAEATRTAPKPQRPWYDPGIYTEICFAGCTAPANPNVEDEATEFGPSIEKGDTACGDVIATLVFPFDRTMPTLESQSVLEEAMRIALECQVESIEIEAHEDRGHSSSAYALGVSERRATSLVGTLMDIGFDGAVIRTTYFGEAKPLRPGHRSPANRRAIVTFDLAPLGASAETPP